MTSHLSSHFKITREQGYTDVVLFGFCFVCGGGEVLFSCLFFVVFYVFWFLFVLNNKPSSGGGREWEIKPVVPLHRAI